MVTLGAVITKRSGYVIQTSKLQRRSSTIKNRNQRWQSYKNWLMVKNLTTIWMILLLFHLNCFAISFYPKILAINLRIIIAAPWPPSFIPRLIHYRFLKRLHLLWLGCFGIDFVIFGCFACILLQ